jgi:hypothetical protein
VVAELLPPLHFFTRIILCVGIPRWLRGSVAFISWWDAVEESHELAGWWARRGLNPQPPA